MTATYLQPFRDNVSLREAMNSLLEDSVVRPFGAFGTSHSRTFPVDIFQTENELVVRASVPGVHPEDLSISVLNGVLNVKAEHTHQDKQADGQYLRQEIVAGTYERAFELPFQVQADKAEATFEHGLLTIRLPKAEEAKPKQIAISVN